MDGIDSFGIQASLQQGLEMTNLIPFSMAQLNEGLYKRSEAQSCEMEYPADEPSCSVPLLKEIDRQTKPEAAVEDLTWRERNPIQESLGQTQSLQPPENGHV